MRDRTGAALLSALVLATAFSVAGAQPTHAAGKKVAIIVGPTGAQTDSYRDSADAVAAAATAAGATVVKAYSPNATWANVKNAVNGANIIVWMGHGNGYPNPYSSTELTKQVNGWGLNRTTTNGDGDSWSSTMIYCGERALLGTLTSNDGDQWTYCGGSANNDGVTPAPGFAMIYAHACYTAGAGEPGEATQTEATYLARVKNYSAPPLRLGAGAYFATTSEQARLVTAILTQPGTSYGDIFRGTRAYAASALRTFAHAEVAGHSIWLQNNGYHYAFAGDPTLTPSGTHVVTEPTDVDRYAGANRYATAAAISAASYAPGVPVAYVATGANFPDALAAGAAAARRGGPVLLVTGSEIPDATATELSRLRPGSIIVVGGASVVSDGVLDGLRAYATSGNVWRIAGATRYETAALISANAFSAPVSVAYVATGKNFPDALAGVAASGAAGGPVLLVTPTEIPGATASELTRLRPGRIVILGSTGVVSSSVASQLAAYATSGVVQRLAGATRYDTAAAISAGSFGSADTVFLATGANFPDALGGGPVAGSVPGPLLLVTASDVPAGAANELRRLDPERVVILGGTGVVSDAVISQVRAILGG
ncbi:MAG TPA: cell wall-binding repeat-containing protein [Candidatus Limnocylindria bacterium]|nr:cell wall-binding repeat-containing protein [Candidatus Limnocylindria bacterium]